MPRRNVWLLVAMTLICLPCHLRAGRYGQILTFAMDQVEHRSLNKVDQRDLFEAAVTGMMARLKDPHSIYIPPMEFAEFRQVLDQEFGGVGIEIVLDPDTKQLTVASPLYGTPAFEAGIRPRDRVLRVDGKSTLGMSLEDASALLRGKLGTPVVLTIQHEGEPAPVEVHLVRATIQVDSVLGEVRNTDGTWNYFLDGHDRIAYLRVNNFGEKTAAELEQALRKVADDGARGLVLDLRNDPGGLLKAAVHVCDMFLDSGVIVTIRQRDGRIRDIFQTTGNGSVTAMPVAILVNKYTASASEIVAACLQDHGRAVVVGQRTYGKGTVQELIELPGKEGSLKLTTASYWRPSGKNINRTEDAKDDDQWGVRPDPGFEVPLEGQALDRLIRWHREVGAFRASGVKPAGTPGQAKSQLHTEVDPQLNRAVQYVESLTPATARP